MSDRDTDPMDKAYVEAEAMLDDDAARAARRARVLAAVAETPAQAAPEPTQRPALWRPSVWGRGGWLVAASVGAVSVFVATQINRPPVYDRPAEPPAPAAPPQSAPAAPQGAATPPPAAIPPLVEPPVYNRPAEPPGAYSPSIAPEREREAARRLESSDLAPPPIIQSLPASPPPPPPPAAAAQPSAAPPAPARPAERRVLGGLAAPRSEAPKASTRSEIEELVVVTGQRKARADDIAALGNQLRNAAAEGQSRQVSVLLSRGVPIDTTDDDGETALMKAVQERRLEVVALLRRRGASLDLKNEAGESARDMAARLADPELDKALGLKR